MSSRLNETFQRINAIDWSQKIDLQKQKQSTRALIQEEIRRLSIWLHTLAPNYQGTILADLTSYINDSIVVPREMLEKITNYKNPSRHRTYFLTMLLKWELLEDTETLDKFDLPHPYEPVLLFYERGASLMYSEHMYHMILDGYDNVYNALRIGNQADWYLTQPALLDLSPENLARIDS